MMSGNYVEHLVTNVQDAVHALDAAAGLAVLDILEREQLVDNWRRMGGTSSTARRSSTATRSSVRCAAGAG
jgi:4-aminobutyrate aminotransferase-like enzyme